MSVRTFSTSPEIEQANILMSQRERRRAALKAARRQRQETELRRQELLAGAPTVPVKQDPTQPEFPGHLVAATLELADSLRHRGFILDAERVANASLGILLRQIWASVQGKSNVNPAIASIPEKLYNRGAIDLQSLRLLRNVTDPERKGKNVKELLVICQILLDLMSENRFREAIEAGSVEERTGGPAE